jgi:hypothetical protein
MAKTFYKYAERSAESQINWNEVGRQMSDVVNEEARIRQEKKAAIDDGIKDFNEYINNQPLGDHQGFNDWTTQFSTDTAEYALQVERLLKSGQMNVRDYTNIRANLQQGTTEAFEFGKEFNTKYAELQKRMEVDPETGLPQAQALEEYMMNSTRGLGNFSSSRLWINPTDGKVLLGKKDMVDSEDGLGITARMQENPGAYAPVNELRNRLNAKYDIYDINKSTDTIAASLGTRIDAIMAGGVKERENPLAQPAIVSAISDAVNGQLASPTNVTSVLTNTLRLNPDGDGLYEFTQDPKAAAKDPNLILMVPNPMQPSSGAMVPMFGVENEEAYKAQLRESGLSNDEVEALFANRDAQYKAAEDTVRTSVESKLNFKETGYEAREKRAQTEGERKSGSAKKQAEQAVTNLAKLWGTSIPPIDVANATNEELQSYNDAVQQEFQAAGNFLAGLNDEVHSISFSEDGSQVIVNDLLKDGSVQPRTPITKGDNVEQFVESLVTAILPDNVRNAADVGAMLKASGITDGLNRHSQTTGEKPFGFDAPAPEPEAQKLTMNDTVDDGFGEEISLINLAKESAPQEQGDETATSLATMNAFDSFLKTAGIADAQATNGVVEIESGSAFVSNTDQPYVNLGIPNVMEPAIKFPANLTEAQWLAVNNIIIDERAKGNQITANMFANLGLENFDELQAITTGGGGPLD